jgi:hypothetical protein
MTVLVKKNHLGLRVLYQYRYGLRNDVCEVHSCILPPFPKASTPRIRASQTFLTLTNFIEKSINIYNILSFKNIFYNKFNGINLV